MMYYRLIAYNVYRFLIPFRITQFQFFEFQRTFAREEVVQQNGLFAPAGFLFTLVCI